MFTEMRPWDSFRTWEQFPSIFLHVPFAPGSWTQCLGLPFRFQTHFPKDLLEASVLRVENAFALDETLPINPKKLTCFATLLALINPNRFSPFQTQMPALPCGRQENRVRIYFIGHCFPSTQVRPWISQCSIWIYWITVHQLHMTSPLYVCHSTDGSLP